MRNVSKFLLSLGLAFAVQVPATVNAACAARDLQGRWDIYLIGDRQFFDEADELQSVGFWVYCQVRVARNGQLTSISACQNDFGSNFEISGQIRISQNCIIRGDLTVPGDVSGQIVRATLTRDKESWTGVAQNDGGANFFEIYLVNAVRR